MSPTPAPAGVRDALARRIAAVAGPLELPSVSDPVAAVRGLADRIVGAGPRESWLAYVALSGTFPTREQLARLRRRVELAADDERVSTALDAVVDVVGRPWNTLRELEVVDDPELVLVDVSFTSDNAHNTGIQRVVRSLLPEWVREGRPIRLVRWSPFGGAYVDLDEIERARVLAWRSGPQHQVGEGRRRDATRTIVVPWGVRVFFPEVPLQPECAVAACLAEQSGSRASVIGYDTIPIASADTVPELESERFAKYLDLVKHAEVVAGISRSASDEFSAFVRALPAQGLVGPRVVPVPLAVDTPAEARVAVPGEGDDDDDVPIVLCVGSHEPRKNQEAVLAAAAQLFAEGVRFRMVFVGGGGRHQTLAFDKKVVALQKRGMAVESHRRMPDSELWSLYRRARFTALLSLHEGFGLPIAESVSLGTPVLTSDYGSVAEVAAAGGCLTVDPRDDAKIAEAMRSLLTDDELIQRLRSEAAAAPSRSWAEYGSELWEQITSDAGEAEK